MSTRWALMQEGQVAPPTLDGRAPCTECGWFRPEQRNKGGQKKTGRCGKVADMNNNRRKGAPYDGTLGLQCSQFAHASKLLERG